MSSATSRCRAMLNCELSDRYLRAVRAAQAEAFAPRIGMVRRDAAGGVVRQRLDIGRNPQGGREARGSRRRARIAAWLETELPAWFEDRVLPVDAGVADEWGRLLARLKKPLPAIDSLIAATALRHRLTIVTRNESDFAATAAGLFNPWKD